MVGWRGGGGRPAGDEGGEGGVGEDVGFVEVNAGVAEGWEGKAGS